MVQDFFKNSYRIFFQGFSNMDFYVSLVSKYQKSTTRRMSTMKTAREAFYLDKNYRFPSSPKDKFKEMANNKLLLVSQDASKYLFGSLVIILKIVEKAVVEVEYVWGRLEVLEYSFSSLNTRFRVWDLGWCISLIGAWLKVDFYYKLKNLFLTLGIAK